MVASKNQAGQTVVSSYSYTVNAIGQCTNLAQSGTAFPVSDGSTGVPPVISPSYDDNATAYAKKGWVEHMTDIGRFYPLRNNIWGPLTGALGGVWLAKHAGSYDHIIHKNTLRRVCVDKSGFEYADKILRGSESENVEETTLEGHRAI